ncbi:MAG: Rieske [2Fe-2S] iron-sulfur protein [Gemmatimonadetes bacterium]|jgi:Rieske Fe-S protein|nr:Rieske [2Fe-2S] iron-sulfur protein [Gemmatimonadota bacterium]
MSVFKKVEDGCEDCSLSQSRRGFLRQSLLAAAAALITLGVNPAAALADSFEPIDGRRGHDQTVKYPIPAADGVQIDKDNQVILVRWQGAAYAFNLSCPHQNTALRWDDADHRFQCPKHHSKYRPDGVFIEGRATRGMDRLSIQREGNDLVVDVDKMFKQDASAAEWGAAVVSLTN